MGLKQSSLRNIIVSEICKSSNHYLRIILALVTFMSCMKKKAFPAFGFIEASGLQTNLLNAAV